jgi:preprotein translocase subunit SecF
MITVGLFSIFDKEFTLPIIAALLTIIGYSLNDTIIVFDRIRENIRKHQKNTLEFIVNRSINETLSRTLLTSMTTLMVLICLFVLGGGIIHDFAFALIVGILVGTYSSIFVASPILLAWQSKK